MAFHRVLYLNMWMEKDMQEKNIKQKSSFEVPRAIEVQRGTTSVTFLAISHC